MKISVGPILLNNTSSLLKGDMKLRESLSIVIVVASLVITISNFHQTVFAQEGSGGGSGSGDVCGEFGGPGDCVGGGGGGGSDVSGFNGGRGGGNPQAGGEIPCVAGGGSGHDGHGGGGGICGALPGPP